MLNDVIFNNEISAYHDWNMVLTSADIPFPEPKTSTVNIKGADGVLDLSEVLSGDVKYSNRTIKLTFEILNDSNYVDLIKEIGNYIHGKKLTFQLTNDELYYYTGRATINNWECVKRKGKIVMSIDCEPYKYRVDETIIKRYVDCERHIILTNERQRVFPTISVEGTITMTYNGIVYNLSNKVYKLSNLYLIEGDNYIKVNGNGWITFTYRMGAL